MNKSEYLHLFKVVLVGNSCVGKSSIVIRYADNQFSDVFLATIGVDFRFKAFTLGSQSVKLQIWDTAGQEKFRTITGSYYRGAHALMIVFDITDLQSYRDAVGYWFQQIKQSCPAQTQILLVGNKSDLQNQRKVHQEQIKAFMTSNPEVRYIQTSAKTCQKVECAFETIAEMLLNLQAQKQQNKAKPKGKQKGKGKVKEQSIKSLQQKNTNKSYCCQN